MLTRVLWAAILAGVVAGLAVSAVHFSKVVPLILQAEVFEAGGGHNHGGEAAEPAQAVTQDHDHAAHEHDAAAEILPGGLPRGLLTIGANILSGIAFSLLLAAGMSLSGQPLTVERGLLWGGAGFAAFSLAPALGLAPELPGMPAADLYARQLWWLGTVIATAGGLALLAFGRKRHFAVLALVLIALPHVIGAPQPDSHDSGVPAALAASFAAASLAASAIMWLVIGGLLGRALPSFALHASKAATA